MPKLQTNAQHDFRYETIALAEGEECIVCHLEHFVPRSSSNRSRRDYKKLEIDHADSNRTNWAWSNLHLVCHKHNCWLRNLPMVKHISLLRSYSDQLEREREREFTDVEDSAQGHDSLPRRQFGDEG
ncbi:hypothetical protein ACFLWS_06570 [Chloroflexota bacterium]